MSVYFTIIIIIIIIDTFIKRHKCLGYRGAMGRLFALKIAPSIRMCMVVSGWFFGSTRVLNSNGISIGSAVFAGPLL